MRPQSDVRIANEEIEGFGPHMKILSAASAFPGNLYSQAIGRFPHTMSWLMLPVNRWPGMQTRAMKTLSSNPAYFQELLSVYVGAESLSRFVLRQGPRLSWSLFVSF